MPNDYRWNDREQKAHVSYGLGLVFSSKTQLRSSSALMDVPLLFWGFCVESFEPTVCFILFTLRKTNELYANISKNIHIHNALMTPRHKKRLRKTTVFCSLLEDLMIEMKGKKKLLTNLKLVSKRYENSKPISFRKKNF